MSERRHNKIDLVGKQFAIDGDKAVRPRGCVPASKYDLRVPRKYTIHANLKYGHSASPSHDDSVYTACPILRSVNVFDCRRTRSVGSRRRSISQHPRLLGPDLPVQRKYIVRIVLYLDANTIRSTSNVSQEPLRASGALLECAHAPLAHSVYSSFEHHHEPRVLQSALNALRLLSRYKSGEGRGGLQPFRNSRNAPPPRPRRARALMPQLDISGPTKLISILY